MSELGGVRMLWGSWDGLGATVSLSSHMENPGLPGSAKCVLMCVRTEGCRGGGSSHRMCQTLLRQRTPPVAYLQAFISSNALTGTEETQKSCENKDPSN